MNPVEEYVKKRDKCVCECWEQFSIEPLDKFWEENKESVGLEAYEQWEKTVVAVKWLTLCTMTLSITSMSVAKYQERANAMKSAILNGGKNGKSKL